MRSIEAGGQVRAGLLDSLVIVRGACDERVELG
jgi:hypothetical protein